jgi:BirA family biotin operon repressor/biotin-[acetyl-CoA-carboxylase] ligase
MLGRKIIKIESVDSTNNYVANLMNGGKIEHGTVILAEEQTNGKGQRGAEWHSNSGENMIFSMYLDTANLSVKDQFVLTQFVSISVSNLLHKIGINSKIKWPNDIYVGNKKIAGILIENQICGSFLSGSVIGIGLNVNQIDFERLNATSVKLETKSFRSIQEILLQLIHELNENWNKILDFKLLKNNYISQLLFFREKARFKDVNGEFVGKIIDVLENGKLLVDKGDNILEYDLKEITFLFY